MDGRQAARLRGACARTPARSLASIVLALRVLGVHVASVFPAVKVGTEAAVTALFTQTTQGAAEPPVQRVVRCA